MAEGQRDSASAGREPWRDRRHLHPVAVVAGEGSVVRRRCFVSAFGAYAGGLDFRHPAFSDLLKDGRRIAHALGRDRVYAISESRCLTGA